ncbi:zinc ribbon domain-containing protein [Candidatus Thorarchaeota archaeon]|nr:MAG: zinc ribbon domain-containing protein [Candidatus Thorarchaeota archaeon]
MVDHIQCPECGKSLGKGSTFCIGCGNKIPEGLELVSAPNPDTLPSLDDSGLDDIVEPVITAEPTFPESEPKVPAKTEELSWDDELPDLPVGETEADSGETTTSAPALSTIDRQPEAREAVINDEPELSWDEGVEEIKEGMPFKEVEPPKIVAVAHATDVTTDDAMTHLFPEVRDDATRDAVTHLFPEGRGSTSATFIDVVVGKPAKVSIKTPLKELDHPSCPNCGVVITADGFEYPTYVFDAMGKARSDYGDKLLGENEHERAIEYYEMAKMLFEKSDTEKNIAEAAKRIDMGYDAMAQFHYDEAETHLKEFDFEWAVVQFKKARELYMFTTDTKKRARCAERAREAYVIWGKALEDEGDKLAKAGKTRDALAKYQEAAAKYREGGDSKRLKGLDSKIRKA